MSQSFNLRRRIASGAVWITLETTGLQVLSLLVFAILARLLTPHDFGLASVAYVMVNSWKIVLFDGFATAVARKNKGSAVEYSTAFWLTVAAAAFSVAALQALSFGINRLFGVEGLMPVLRIMSVMLLAQGLARTQEVWLSRHFLYRTLAIRSLVGAVLGGAIGIGLALKGYGAWALAAQQVTGSVFAFVLLWFTCPWRPEWIFSRLAAKEILIFCLSTIGNSLLYALNYSFDTMLIGVFFGPVNAGMYNLAKRLRLALQFVAAAPINGISLPVLAEVQNDKSRFTRVFLVATTIVLAVCGPIFLGAAVISSDMIILVFGPNWVASAPLFQWLAIGGLCTIVIDYHTNVFLALGRPQWTFYLALLNGILTIIVFFVIAVYHLDFVAAPFVLPCVVTLPISIVALLRISEVTFRSWAQAVAGPWLASIVMMLAGVAVQPALRDLPLVSRLLILICASALVYGTITAFMFRKSLATIVQLVRNLHRANPMSSL